MLNKEIPINFKGDINSEKTIDEILHFIELTSSFNSDIDLVDGKIVIDSKSLLGVFSMNLGKVLILRIISNDEDEIRKFNKTFEEYKYTEEN